MKIAAIIPITVTRKTTKPFIISHGMFHKLDIYDIIWKFQCIRIDL